MQRIQLFNRGIKCDQSVISIKETSEMKTEEDVDTTAGPVQVFDVTKIGDKLKLKLHEDRPR